MNMRMFSYALMAATFLLIGCVTKPKFTKALVVDPAAQVEGYSVRELSVPNHIEVIVHLPVLTSADIFEKYGFRAIGEECLARGFKFFDISDESRNMYSGFCYRTNEKQALNITFSKSGLVEKPRKFFVDDLNGKETTLLKENDQVISLNGQALTSMAQLKALVFALPPKTYSVSLQVFRKGQQLTLNEPLLQLPESLLTVSELEKLRKDIP